MFISDICISHEFLSGLAMKAAVAPYPFSGNIYNVQGKVRFIGKY